MGKHEKCIPGSKSVAHQKVVSNEKYSTDGRKVQWCFDYLDKGGKFAFNLSREDFDHYEVLEKIIAYSNMTWSEVKRQTHDDGKSKHHFLDLSKISREAVDRISAKRFDGIYDDAIFSFAFQNKLRIIGVRDNEKFHGVWFDPQHEFCPSGKGK